MLAISISEMGTTENVKIRQMNTNVRRKINNKGTVKTA